MAHRRPRKGRLAKGSTKAKQGRTLRSQWRKVSPASIIAGSLDTQCGRSDVIQKSYEIFQGAVKAAIEQTLPPNRRLVSHDRLSCKQAIPKDNDHEISEHRFWDAWLKNESHLRKYCLSLLWRCPDEVEDVLGKVMLRAATKFRSEKINNHRAWLRRFVHNACMDYYRNNALYDRSVSDITNALHGSESESPQQGFERAETLKRIEQDLLDLPENLRTPLLLRFIDVSYDEISRILDITNGTARKRIQLARDRLRQKMH